MKVFAFSWLLAQAEQGGKPQTPDTITMMLPFLAIAVLFYFMLIRPQQREQANRKSMLNTLKKNDRVLTIGGILGTVANISEGGEEVTLKVDDNTRIKFKRSSIQQILGGDGEGDKGPASS